MARGLGKTRTPKKLPKVASDQLRPAENIVAFSGGKDSTSTALRLAEDGEDFVLLFTPTGNELPELHDHIERIVELTGKTLVRPPNRSLAEWIEFYNALPNWRMRWCTRQIKIEPCIAYLVRRPGSTLSVGLRADEPLREGLYGPYATYRYPLRDWGWGLEDVTSYLESRNVSIPERTDCAVCPYQRLGEWYRLWLNHPEHYKQGEEWERQTGYTFRSPSRDTWPASMAGLRAEFEKGRVPRGGGSNDSACRVCRF